MHYILQQHSKGSFTMSLPSTSHGENDFDFFIGHWQVAHHRLQERLDDNMLQLPDGPYRAVTLRTFDTDKQQWSIWWLDGRYPGQLDVPVVGRFDNGVGTFYADDNFNGKPIRVRFLWTQRGADQPRWEQAFSADAGANWETNWVMDFTRISS
jgi:hypothetical protein